jgi:hypothetical protein
MDQHLQIKHTKDRHGEPLAVVHNLPGLFAELNADQLRRLATALVWTAEECERGTGTLMDVLITIDLDSIITDEVTK